MSNTNQVDLFMLSGNKSHFEADDSVFDHLALKEPISDSDSATAKPCMLMEEE